MISLQIPVPLDAIAAFCQRHHIKKMSLFGSVLREDFRPDSDVDVLVEFDGQAATSYLSLASVQLELAQLIGRDIDVGTPASLSPYIRDEVLSKAAIIYEPMQAH